MPVSDKTTLKELKALIKEHAKALPKMSSGKTALALYAEKNGLLKRSEAEVVPLPVKVAAPKKELPPVTKPVVKKSAPVEPVNTFQKQPVMPQLPKSLIKKAPAAADLPTKKAPSGFALFMSQNKGQGFTMSQMSQMYKETKDQQ